MRTGCMSAVRDELPDGLQVLRIPDLRFESRTLMDDEIWVIFWTKLHIDVDVATRLLCFHQAVM